MPSDIEIIETPAGLKNLADHLRSQQAIAVDLEADSMYHFREKVCLIQTATDRKKAIIDPLRLRDLSPLGSVFADATVKKVFHGADYDVRSLYRDFKFDIKELFDTQVACKFLGMKATGLESVLLDHFGIQLDKKFQRKDWSVRPLPDEMLAYAADDVGYLLPLAQRLEKSLQDKGRWKWVREECDLLSRVRPTRNDHEPLFMHFKGAGRLRPRNLAVLEALLHYRRRIAKVKDRPLFKIFSNKSLLQLAIDKPTKLKRLASSGALSQKQLNMYGDELAETIKQALRIPAADLPVYPRQKAPAINTAVPLRMKALKKWRDKKARVLNLEPGVLLNKSAMTALASVKPTNAQSLKGISDLKQWQIRELGPGILKVLNDVK